MEKIVGNVISKSSGKSYRVKWNTDDQTSWINIKINTWEMICTNVKTEEAALSCVQRFIDSQPDSY